MQNKDVSGKVALITGGARRIGATIVQALHSEGMQIVVHYRGSGEDARALQAKLNALRSDSVALVRGDLLEVTELKNLVRRGVEAFGRLDVLVNNASRFYPTPVDDTTEEQWDQLVDTNLKAPFFLCQAAAPELRKHKGCVVNICDIYAERPLGLHPVYCATKAGLVSLT
ncbi:MAG: SDR family NAD(P)-dependent oxidoreductase, partial [Gammaproteobacteria bacterium]|nr:SDR family NAD(P)-dependent oxidoreductase [Gammaproteobacteria bacterium]